MELPQNQYENLSKETLISLLEKLTVVTQEITDDSIKLQREKNTLENENSQLEEKSTKLEEKSAKLEGQVNALKFQLEQLKRMIFGTKSERFISTNNPEQLQIPFDVDLEQISQEAIQTQEIIYERQKKARKEHPGRFALPTHLPVNEIIIEPEQDTAGMVFIGNEVTDELEYEPGKLFINRYLRPKYVAKENEDLKQEVVIGTLDFRPIHKCIAGANLLTQIVVDKYIDHLPIYRQLQRFARDGINIPTSTIESWQKLLAELLNPLYQILKQNVLKNGYLQGDESTIKVQDRTKKGKTHTGYMWVFRAPIPDILFFEYHPGRIKEYPVNILNGFEGYLQTDAYNAYTEIGKSDKVVHLGCWAHARRKFEQALNYDNEKASYVLTQIQQLYAIERTAKEEELNPKQKHALRLEKALPIINELGKYIYNISKYQLPKSPLAEACNYCTNRWDNFLNYLKDGQLEIDNNNIENAIRPLALGRKNYLFAGSHKAAENIAMYYSFFATCKKQNINPKKWLVYVQNKINQTKANELYKLLPHIIDKNLLS